MALTPDVEARLAACLAARLTPLDHLSLNATYRADQPQYDRTYFVKVYAEPDKLRRDKLGLLAVWPDWYVADLVLEGRPVLIQTWQELTPLTAPTLDQLRDLGRLLAQTHEQLAPLADQLRTQPPLSQQIQRWHADLVGTPEEARLAELYAYFAGHFAPLDAAYEAMAKRVLHGDYSWRNLKGYGEGWAVIDFERLVVDLPWRELGKLWLREVTGEAERAAFLAGYRERLPLEEPSPLLKAALDFQLAQGIYRYVSQVEDAPFRAMADGLIDDVRQWVAAHS